MAPTYFHFSTTVQDPPESIQRFEVPGTGVENLYRVMDELAPAVDGRHFALFGVSTENVLSFRPELTSRSNNSCSSSSVLKGIL